jgi:hypothetical protein
VAGGSEQRAAVVLSGGGVVGYDRKDKLNAAIKSYFAMLRILHQW